MHGIISYGFSARRKRIAVNWMAWMILLNSLGPVFYALKVSEVILTSFAMFDAYQGYKFSEKTFLRRFDMVGSGHQIFHILISVAAVVHYDGSIGAFHEVRGSEHSCMA
jgi:predicted membrane channel-forming protein YqfA (hemolysin III family)